MACVWALACNRSEQTAGERSSVCWNTDCAGGGEEQQRGHARLLLLLGARRRDAAAPARLRSADVQGAQPDAAGDRPGGRPDRLRRRRGEVVRLKITAGAPPSLRSLSQRTSGAATRRLAPGSTTPNSSPPNRPTRSVRRSRRRLPGGAGRSSARAGRARQHGRVRRAWLGIGAARRPLHWQLVWGQLHAVFEHFEMRHGILFAGAFGQVDAHRHAQQFITGTAAADRPAVRIVSDPDGCGSRGCRARHAGEPGRLRSHLRRRSAAIRSWTWRKSWRGSGVKKKSGTS